MTSLKCNLTVNKNPKILKGKLVSHRRLFSILENLSLQGKIRKRWYFYYCAVVFILNVTYNITCCIAKTSRTKLELFFFHLIYAWAQEQQNIKKKRKKRFHSSNKQALLTWLTLRDDFTKWLRIFEVSSHDCCSIESLGMGEMDTVCSDLC